MKTALNIADVSICSYNDETKEVSFSLLDEDANEIELAWGSFEGGMLSVKNEYKDFVSFLDENQEIEKELIDELEKIETKTAEEEEGEE